MSFDIAGYLLESLHLLFFALHDEFVVDHNEQVLGGILTANGLVLNSNVFEIK